MKKPRIAFYGDDFTGSTDAMEVLHWAGLPTALFFAPPDAAQLSKFPKLEAFGVAGSSRSMSPEEMQRDLRPILRQLRDSGAEIVHYKTCSTFDSSPDIGNIGKAIEIGRELFGHELVPIVVGAPHLGRYQVFGNLFARSGPETEAFRLDRHPTMTQHPITPMDESDIRYHLARQTKLRIGLHDILKLQNDGKPNLEVLNGLYEGLLFDLLLPEHLAKVGSILTSIAERQSSSFMVGSSGIEAALTRVWNLERQVIPNFNAVDQMVVITGSCSPVNERQIAWAEKHGFESLAINTARLVDDRTCESEINRMIDTAKQQLRRGANLILHSSRGPKDPRITSSLQAMRNLGFSEMEIKLRSGKILGPKFGRILKGILSEHKVSRVGIAGGDTTSFIARELELVALETIASLAPGAPLCRAHASTDMDGLELVFKGGQVGKDDVWGTLLHGNNTLPKMMSGVHAINARLERL